MEILLTARQPNGGIKTFFRYIYSQKEFENIKFTLLAPDDGLSDYLQRYMPDGRLTVVPVEHSNLGLLSVSRDLLSSRKFSLLHSHGFSAGAISQLAKTGIDIPHLMTAHDVFRPEQFSGFKGAIKRRLLSGLYKKITAVHTVTEDARNNLLEFLPRLDSKRIYNILHGVSTEYFAEGTPRDLRTQLNLKSDQPLIGFFGRFMAQKGFRTLIDAMEILKAGNTKTDAMPKVLTFGWGGYIREDYQYLEAKGLADYFHQMPATDSMPDMLKSVDMVVMPSRWEACGLLAMEALASGTPLIATNCVGLREVLEGTPSRVIEPLDANGLAAQIDLELSHPSKNQFAAYQPKAIARFAIDRPARELLELYNGIAKQKMKGIKFTGL